MVKLFIVRTIIFIRPYDPLEILKPPELIVFIFVPKPVFRVKLFDPPFYSPI